MENVKSRVIELMQRHFSWLSDDEDTPDGVTNKIASQCETFDALGISRDELLEFVDVLIKEFDLEDIEFSEVMKWRRVKDMVDYLEDNLEAALDDMPSGV